MRARRLLELLLRLQVQGGASASELASALEVSVRTVYRDVEALCAAGVPIHTEVGRNGGIRIDPAYRVAGMPRLEPDDARGVLFAVVPTLATQLGFDAGVADRALLPAMDVAAEQAARIVRDRLLVEPSHWFAAPDETPALAEVARGVWEGRELRLTYRGADVVVQPLGLILKGTTWYLLGGVRQRGRPTTRLYRLSRVEGVDVLDHRFERPAGFDLAAAWAERRQAFFDALPAYDVTVAVSPAAEPLLALLDEGAPALPLPADVERDERGWAVLRLRFERSAEGTARHLLQLGAGIVVIDPPELRAWLANEAAELASRYRDPGDARVSGGSARWVVVETRACRLPPCSYAGAMEVRFERTGARRYATVVVLPGRQPRRMDPAPGYDDEIPHDLVHYLVEAELGLALGVFGRAAAGGGGFLVAVATPGEPRRRAREQRRQRRREVSLGRVDPGDMARSEELAALCDLAWRRRAGARTPPWAEHRDLPADDRRVVEAVLGHLEQVAPRWRSLHIGDALSFSWPQTTARGLGAPS